MILLGSLSSCDKPGKIQLATHLKGTAIESVAIDMSDYLNGEGWEIEVLAGADYGSEKNVSLVESQRVELAFLMNSLEIKDKVTDIHTVLPFYPLIVYILHRSSNDITDLEVLLRGKKIGMIKDQSAFFNSLLEYFGVPVASNEINMVPGFDNADDLVTYVNNSSMDVFLLFAIPNSPHVRRLLSSSDWQLFSLDDIDYAGKGSSVEGFCLYYPRAYPYIIPKNVFGQYPESPVYSLAMDMLLVTNAESDDRWVHDLTRDILEGRHYLSQKNVLFARIREHFDRDVLNFPLHIGALDYLDRNEPSFFERYAEAFGVVFSILVVLAGVLSSLRRIKKERIDQYYKKAMALNSVEELEKLEEKAIEQLEKDRLSADESFTIFLTIVEKRKRELTNRPNQ
jgi:TRAP-type uncharacterized transport system substrate-binding protein